MKRKISKEEMSVLIAQFVGAIVGYFLMFLIVANIFPFLSGWGVMGISLLAVAIILGVNVADEQYYREYYASEEDYEEFD